PQSGYVGMDWVRSPVDGAELMVRVDNLERRLLQARAAEVLPEMSTDDRLHFGHRWVAVPPSEVRALHLLIGSYRMTVPTTELVEAMQIPAPIPATITTRVARLRQRSRR